MDDAAEFLLEIDGVERDAQPLGHLAGIGRIAGAATALLARGVSGRSGASHRLLPPMPHEQSDHVMAGLAEQPGRHAAIDASGHGKDNAGHGTTERLERKHTDTVDPFLGIARGPNK